MIQKTRVFLLLYTAMVGITIVSMIYNVKSIRLHDACVKMKLQYQANEDAIQQIQLKHNELYSLNNINYRAQRDQMKRPKKVNFISLQK